MFFGTWINIDYYDYYGPVYLGYNGFDVMTSTIGLGLFPRLIPALVTTAFIIMFIKFNSKKDDKLVTTSAISCALILIMVWFFNVVVEYHSGDAYYDEYHYGAYAGSVAFAVSIVNIIIASCIEKKSRPAPIRNDPVRTKDRSNYVRYCHRCGSGLTEGQLLNSHYCYHCGAPLDDEKPQNDNEQTQYEE